METTAFTIDSFVFKHGEEIPMEFTSDGRNMSPPLQWHNIPSGTQELVLLFEDPDAVQDPPFVHWLVYNIPPNIDSLEQGEFEEEESEIRMGQNSDGEASYKGPKPPEGTGRHRYYFKLYALDEKMNLPEGLTKDDVFEKARNHIIGETEFMGKYWYH